MDTIKKIAGLLIFVLLFQFSDAQKLKLAFDQQFIDGELTYAARQIKYLESQIGASEIPTSFKNGKHINWGTSWWCSGFYPGTALYLYEASGDTSLLTIAKTKLIQLEKEKTNTTTHDLGFMLYCSFGNALRLTGDSAAYKEILITGAQSLATRFSEVTGTIRSWDSGKNWDGIPWH